MVALNHRAQSAKAADVAPSETASCLIGLRQILCPGRTLLADELIDVDEIGAELLEAADGGHLAMGLADLGGIGERVLDRLDIMLEGEAELGTVPGMLVTAARAVGHSAAAENSME